MSDINGHIRKNYQQSINFINIYFFHKTIYYYFFELKKKIIINTF